MGPHAAVNQLMIGPITWLRHVGLQDNPTAKGEGRLGLTHSWATMFRHHRLSHFDVALPHWSKTLVKGGLTAEGTRANYGSLL